MTYALLALAVAGIIGIVYLTNRFWMGGALASRPQALMSEPTLTVIDGGLPPTGHMVFSGPVEHNEHGFITTPRVACIDPKCPCRSFIRPPL